MIKLSLQKLEKNLGLKLKKNIYCVGVDTASTTGVSFLTITDKSATFEWELFKLPVLPKKDRDKMEKAEKYDAVLDFATAAIRELKKNCKTTENGILVLEQSFLQMNPDTYGELRALQGIFYAELYNYFDTVKIWLPGTVRKMVGFHSILNRSAERKDKKQEIVNWVNNILGTKIENDNISDAIILSLAGVIKEE
jgi:Holliday junction resolvasome RuvABC endonuclease subunit